MKRVLFCLLALLCVACSTEIDFGYPAAVAFSSEGGEKVISSSKPFYGAYIEDYNNGGTGTVSPEDEMGNHYFLKFLLFSLDSYLGSYINFAFASKNIVRL